MRKGVLSLIERVGTLVAVVAWLILADISPAGAAAASASSTATPSMAIVDGNVTAKFVDVSLKKVLEVVARESGARVLFYGALEGNVSIELKNAPLEEGLWRILQGRNTAYFYSSQLNGFGNAPKLELTEIHVFANADEASDPSIFDSPGRPSAAIRASRAMVQVGVGSKHPVDAELLSQLAQAQDVQARKDAADELGKSWSEDAVEPLGDALAGDPSAAVREAAAQALGKTWSESAVQPLIDALAYDSDALVREQAARGLAQTAGEEAINALVFALMRDPRWYVRDAAAEALGTIGGRYADEALARAAANDPDGWVRETAASYAVKRGK
jgi:hypothetical protein